MNTDFETIYFEGLSRRVLACPRWRWVVGMACGWKDPRGTERVVSVNPSEKTYMIADIRNPDTPSVWQETEWSGSRLPNLSDPATLGCILALVREHCPDVTMNWAMLNGERRWAVYGALTRAGMYLYHTEAEALVAALEAAP